VKVHVLCEKPLAASENECRRMIRACDDAGVRLMTAYRLHFDRVNLRIIEQIQSGAIGDLRMFNSTFSMQVREGDIRTQRELGGGPIWDIGIYCINATRYLFRSEPTEVVAFSESVKGDPRFNEVESTVSAMLRFPDNRIATFVCSFGAASVDSFRIVGDKGDIQVDYPYSYRAERKVVETIDDKSRRKSYRSRTSSAGNPYFSDCLINGTKPEPDGVEGLADVRIIEAINKSIDEGNAGTTSVRSSVSSGRTETRRSTSSRSASRNPSRLRVQAKTESRTGTAPRRGVR
jgi:glucose-fructose oxidoreductase